MEYFLPLIFWLNIVTDTSGEVSVDRYGLRGGSVRLPFVVEFQQRQTATEIKWMVKNDIIAEIQLGVSPHYRDKVEFNRTDFSLLINNLENTDSGIYIASMSLPWKTATVVARYRLTVQEAVSRPALNVILQSNSSGGLCSVSLNCSVAGGWASYDCDQETCSDAQPAQARVNITVSSGNGSIQCTASNHVSTESHSERLEDLCTGENTAMRRSSQSLLVWIAVPCAVVPLASVALVFIVKHCWEMHADHTATEGAEQGPQLPVDTVYSTVCKGLRAQHPATANTANNPAPPVACSLQHGPTSDPGAESIEKAEPEQKPGPQRPLEVDTVYCTVNEGQTAQHPPVDNTPNNPTLPDTIYYTLGEI